MTRKERWAEDAIFYHIYPLGLCGAPLANDFQSVPVDRMDQLYDWIPHITGLGCNALYLGPVFESDFHGYDTADYFMVDRRLGTNRSLQNFINTLHQHGVKVVLDTVFNHVGRNFWAFQDLQLNKDRSAYKDWFAVDFNRDNVYGDGFSYEGWYDAYNLVRLNLRNEEVKEYLFSVVAFWIKKFNIDGLRLDVAEIMDKQFLKELTAYCRKRHDSFWLLGEVITGNYNDWANEAMLDSTTNYEAYKGLYSCHNERNYHEIAYTLNKQSGYQGIYQHLYLYNFADNHDTSRAASILNDLDNLFPLYALLFTIPGIPSIYYGSEWGQQGVKGKHDDTALRPEIREITSISNSPLAQFIQTLARIRHSRPALRHGWYQQLFVAHEQLVFMRVTQAERIIIAVNMSEEQVYFTVGLEMSEPKVFTDQLDPDYQIYSIDSSLNKLHIPAKSVRILVMSGD
jgi:glycosidase